MWAKRLENYRYSQDDRMLAYKYQQELETKFDSFLANASQKSLLVGTFDVEKEPWRNMAIKETARKFQLKTAENVVGNLPSNNIFSAESTPTSLVEYTVLKQKLSTIHGK
jgi:hypothetical protein